MLLQHSPLSFSPPLLSSSLLLFSLLSSSSLLLLFSLQLLLSPLLFLPSPSLLLTTPPLSFSPPLSFPHTPLSFSPPSPHYLLLAPPLLSTSPLLASPPPLRPERMAPITWCELICIMRITADTQQSGPVSLDPAEKRGAVAALIVPVKCHPQSGLTMRLPPALTERPRPLRHHEEQRE